MAPTDIVAPNGSDHDSILARLLEQLELPRSPASPKSTMVTPTEPKAMTIAKSMTPDKRLSWRERACVTRANTSRELLLGREGASGGYSRKITPPHVKQRQRAGAPSPTIIPPQFRLPEYVPASRPEATPSTVTPSSGLVVGRSRKRGIDNRSPSLTPKRRVSHDRTPISALQITRDRIDHYSPPSSRSILARRDHWSRPSSPSPSSSPVRATKPTMITPAAKWYEDFKHSRSIASPSPEPLAHRPRVATPSPTATPSPVSKKYPSLLSIAIPDLEDEAERKRVCYSCGKKGHWFMDCEDGCGKCGGNGHRTIDCKVVHLHTGDFGLEG